MFLYGFPAQTASFDGIFVEGKPHCVVGKHEFTKMWRFIFCIMKYFTLILYDFVINIPKMAEKRVKMSFPDHDVNKKLVDNVENYLNMKFQPKLMQRSRENGQKPHFSKNCL